MRASEPFEPTTSWWWHRRRQLLELAPADDPVFVYHLPTIEHAAARLLAVPGVARVLYAMKANPHPQILACLVRRGLGLECVSAGELLLANECLASDPSRTLFTANFAPRHEYEQAVAIGATLTLDGSHPVEHWPELLRGQAVLLRVDPGRRDGHHRHVQTSGRGSKFGVLPAEVPRLADAVHAAGARLIGLHSHVGSGLSNPGSWAQVAGFLARLADDLHPSCPDLRVLNLGGGLPVAERPGESGFAVESIDLPEALRSSYSLWLEPGRFLVAEAGVLLARVTQIKSKGGTRFIGLGTGMNTLIRPALYGAYHHLVNLTREPGESSQPCTVVGPICESADVFGEDRWLPERTSEGDVILVAHCGAYGAAMSSTYNSRPRAAEVVLAD